MFARAALAAIFVTSGLRSVTKPESLAPTAQPVIDQIAPLIGRVAPGVPTDAATLVRCDGAVQLVGGLLLASGRMPRLGATMLAASLVPTTWAGHRYWEQEDPAQRRNQQVHFMKNLGLLGGLLLAAVDTEGRPGLRWRTRHAAGHARDAADRISHRTAREVRRAAHTARRDARIAAKAAAMGRRLG